MNEQDVSLLPYCYMYEAKTQLETLLGRKYQPLVRRNFMEASTVEFIDFFPSKELGISFGPKIEYDFIAWLYDDGNSAYYYKETRKRMQKVLRSFQAGEDIRDDLYNVHNPFQFPDLMIMPRKKGFQVLKYVWGR